MNQNEISDAVNELRIEIRKLINSYLDKINKTELLSIVSELLLDAVKKFYCDKNMKMDLIDDICKKMKELIQ